MAELPQRSSPPPPRGPAGSTSWYCEIAGQQHGPMEFRELRMLAINRQLLGHHPVWRSGSDERQEANSIVGLIPPPKKKVEDPPPSDVSDKDPYATPKVRTIADGPPGGMYLPHLRPAYFSLLLLAVAVTGGLFYFGSISPDPNNKPIIFSLASIGLLCCIFLVTVFLHRAWDMMHMFGALLTGGKAVRFLFFPIFNALWSFVVVYGWSKLWNYNVKNHPGLAPASMVWKPFFFLFPILFLVSQTLVIVYLVIQEWPFNLHDPVHRIAMGIWAVSLVVGLVCWFQISRSINFLARKKS